MTAVDQGKNSLDQKTESEKESVKLSVAVVVLGILNPDTVSLRKVRMRRKLGVLLTETEEACDELSGILPKGEVYPGESLQKAAERILQEKTGLTGIRCEQFHTFDIPSKERETGVLCVYVALTDRTHRVFPGTFWALTDKTDTNQTASFDCRIIRTVLKCLRRHIYRIDLVFGLMPETFTLSQLQQTYETILEKDIYPIEFQRNIEAQIAEVKEYSGKGAKREKLYRHLT